MKLIASRLFVVCAVLLCGALTAVQAKGPKRVPFDAYGAINAEDASARLDNFAIELQKQPAATAVVIAYGPTGKMPGSAAHVLNVTQAYLVSGRGIEASRIQTINAGRYKDPGDLFNELWIVPPGTPAPEAKRYNSKLKDISGKFAEVDGWDDGGIDNCVCGPPFGTPTLAAYSDLLRKQTGSIGYIVAFNVGDRALRTWSRVAKHAATVMKDDGIDAKRIRIIYGGKLKPKEDNYAEARLQYWILPEDSPAPVKEAKPESMPKESVKINSYFNYQLKYPTQERRIFEDLADVLRADSQLRACLIVRSEIPTGENGSTPTDPPINEATLAGKWKAELVEKLGISETRIFIINAGADEYKGGSIEVWAVPPGASLPDPYKTDSEPAPHEP